MNPMTTIRRIQLSIPMLATALTIGPVLWVLPNGLGFWRSFAIVSGWAGCGMLLASLLLMIREPGLAFWMGGLERMYLWHHRLGVFAYTVLLVHPLALAADAWNESSSQAWSVLAPWYQGLPVWLGWMSLVCMMCGLGIALSPHIRYAYWHGFHHLLTASIILGVIHLLALGINYSLLWAPVLAIAFLLWRILRSDLGLGAKPYMVGQVERLAKDTIEVMLIPLAQPVKARPGQFVLAAFYNGAHFLGCGEYHPFTISAIRNDGKICLAIKSLGDCTHNLQTLDTGVAVRIQGPFGTFLDGQSDQPSLWIAGGIGITPFLAVLRSQKLEHPIKLIYLHRGATGDHGSTEGRVNYLDEITRIAMSQPQLRIQCVETGNQTPDLRTILPEASQLAAIVCYLCGPQSLVKTAREILLERGVSEEHIHVEQFDFRQ